MENQITAGVGSLLTTGTIFKIWLIEFAVCELLIALFVVLKLSFPGSFSMSLNGEVMAIAGDRVSDFVVLTVFALLVTIVLSLFLWVGQSLLGSILPLSFRLR